MELQNSPDGTISQPNTFGVVIPSRNDDYGKNLLQRARYCLNSMLHNLDEVIYVDWNTPDDRPTLAEEIINELDHKEKFKCIRVPESLAREFTNNDPDVQACTEVLARNIGLRRLSTTHLISSDIDIICPPRQFLEVVANDTMVILAERSICPFDLWKLGNYNEPEKIAVGLVGLESQHPQKPDIKLHPDDFSCLISSCGDFQLAPKELWYAIRGFEESLTGRGYADGNVQRKALVAGYQVLVHREIPMWHIGHEVGMGGTGRLNDMMYSIFMTQTTNPETWGYSDREFEVQTW